MSDAGACSPPSPACLDALAERYERLRRHVLGCTHDSAGGHGWGVLARHGMRAWIDASLNCAPAIEDRQPTKSAAARSLPSPMHAELTAMLAAIVLNNNQQEKSCQAQIIPR